MKLHVHCQLGGWPQKLTISRTERIRNPMLITLSSVYFGYMVIIKIIVFISQGHKTQNRL